MTAVIEPGARQEEAAVAEWILGLGLDLEAPLSFERLGNGYSNLTYRVTDAAARSCVLRRPPFGPLLPSAHDIAREHRVLCALATTQVPAPAVYGFTDDPAVADVPLLVAEFVDGLVAEDAIVCDAGARSRTAQSLVQALALIHEVDLAATGLDGLGSHAPYAQRQLKRWRRQWEMSKMRELPALTRLGERLESVAPPQLEVTLVHGDYHLQNAIVTPGGEEVLAILDWELCTLGDPIADVGTLLGYWPEPSGVAGLPSRTEVAEAYAEQAGRDLLTLPFWHALALWKVAIICEGVRRRRPGAFSNEVVEELVERATAVADEAAL